jgi:hypothetical protein
MHFILRNIYHTFLFNRMTPFIKTNIFCFQLSQFWYMYNAFHIKAHLQAFLFYRVAPFIKINVFSFYHVNLSTYIHVQCMYTFTKYFYFIE